MISQFRTTLSWLLTVWHRFWLAPTDPIVPSVLRIFAGGMLFYTLLVWGVDLEAFFLHSGGWQSAELVGRLQQGEWVWSFWWLVPDALLWQVHYVCLAIVFAYWIGLATPLTKWLSLAIVVSYANRVPLANFGLDQFNTMLTMYLCLGPCGARLSVDRALLSWKAKARNRILPPPTPSSAAGLSLRMVQVHLCIVYFFAGISKLQGFSWWSGEAVWLAAANYEYQQFSLTWLAEVPWLYQAATIGTWVWEISFAFLVWNRFCRPWVLLAGISMHIGIGMFMGMWTFGFIMCFAYLAFVPARAVCAVLRRLHLVSSVPVVRNDTSSGDALRIAARLPNGCARNRNTVVLVEPRLRKRYAMTIMLRQIDYRCIAVDSWPDAVRVFHCLGACCVICHAADDEWLELESRVDQLQSDSGEFLPASSPMCLALVPVKQLSLRNVLHDPRIVVASAPIRIDDLAAILEGHVPLHLFHSDADCQQAGVDHPDHAIATSENP